MPRLSKIGAAALAAFGWTGLSSVTASYLVVAGGGGGGSQRDGSGSGGGGAGGFLTGTASLNPTESYTVTVGAGGSGPVGGNPEVNGGVGSNSVFNAVTSTGGGGGGKSNTNGTSGGSGGGGGGNTGTGGSGTVGQGNNGGNAASIGGGGGGGASAAGSANTTNRGGNGGAGTASSITGSSVTYAGGGGGGGESGGGGAPSSGGAGGGGSGGIGPGGNGVAGTANLGGGGGGGSGNNASPGGGGQGGSGVVIISYVGAQQFGGGVVTSSGGNTIHTFNTSGTLSPLSSLTANFLVVAGGGGGGGAYGGGGGAGGLRSSVTNTGGGGSLESALTIDTNSIYLVTVGAGGVGAQYTVSQAGSGSNSAFLSITSTGGGRSGLINTAGASGGSGGGGGSASGTGAAGGSGTANQGFAGGTGAGYDGVNGYAGGGGGGAGAVGQSRTALQNTGGNGGAGVTVAITGSSVGYAGGGGGSGYTTSGGTATDGGGAGADYNVIGSSGSANKGGGGGGGGAFPDISGAGGSGVVIISYAGSTQQMAGGTVTVSGGNVIHTFTSSGYLTPIVLATNSLRFRSSAGAYLNRTPATTTNRRTWTWSGWVKRGTLGTNQSLFTCYFANNDTSYLTISFTSDNLNIGLWNTSILYTSAVYRDPSAWYHIVLAIDTTQATASDRAKLYVNGTQVTAFGSTGYPAQNTDLAVNSAAAHYISTYDGTNYKFDGYMADINFVDGLALTPNSFGTSNGLGIWQPIRYGGSYGTNGFYLPFTNTTSTTTLGYDFSPQGNNWTTNNISLTAGTTYDSMNDVPTNTSATVANYCVGNPLSVGANTSLSNANLSGTLTGSGGWSGTICGLTSGKWYYEATVTANSGNTMWLGFLSDVYTKNDNAWSFSTQTALYGSAAGNNGNNASYGATWTTNDVIGVAIDLSTSSGSITFYKNGVSQGVMFSSLTSSAVWRPLISGGGTGTTIAMNFGQRPFAYTPPTGYVRLNTFNLPTPTIGATASSQANEYFDVSLWTGNGASSQVVTNSGSMQPDFVWIKSRNQAFGHLLFDSVRGISLYLQSNSTGAEVTDVNMVSSLNSNGFTVGSSGFTNGNTYTQVGWQWRSSNATAVTNTSGSITSTVSANTTAGFSIVSYTGTGANATVGHGLGVAPSMIIVRNRDIVQNWIVGHTSLWTANANYQLILNSTNAVGSNTAIWNGTVPTSSVFSIGTDTSMSGNTNKIIAYCWSEIAGFSKFGSYTGNGSTDGTFVYLGFRPRFIMVKKYSSTENWAILDSSRSPYNVTTADLYPDLANAEDVNARADLLSNGIKFRTGGGQWNLNGADYIYMAFAENPFKYANAR